ncbi:11267_t:CDS:10 [Diversispora eburnea]|uniref:11267_t:CDS:1 n=1 Tax=Diversispora eburnea TaxID=1213867 RepID=A0A9N8Z2E4_9GLOM|nr:11267_t:CDS:10 [Diversispora eburnea]
MSTRNIMTTTSNLMTITTNNTINNSIENPSSLSIPRNIIEFNDNDLDLNDIRKFALEKLDNEKFGWFHIRICMITGIGFLTDSYDLFAINIVSAMLGYAYFKDQDNEENAIILGLWLKISAAIGTIIGQILFGIYADKLGRKRIYGIELMIVIIATAGSMLSANSFSISLFNSLIFWRLLLGIGIGGDYPLSSVITSEFSTKKRRGTMMAAVFAMQGFGIFFATIISIITLKILEKQIQKNDNYLDYAWRAVLGVGIIPAFIGLYFRLVISESPRWTMDVQGNVEKGARDVDTIIFYHSLIKPEEETFEPTFLATIPKPSFKDFCHYFSKTENLRNFVAICISWFVLDATFYGIGLNRETIIYKENDVNKSNDSYQSLYDLIIGNMIITVVGSMPGYWCSVILIDKLGRKFIQLMGFAMLTLCYVILGFAYRAINNVVFILLLTLSMFFHNFGPNTTTFVIAGELFPTRYRSTCNGIAAASGKLGAIIAQIGFFKFKDIGGKNQFVDKLLQIFAIFSLIGFLKSLYKMSSPPEINQDEIGEIEFERERDSDEDEEYSIEKIKQRHDYDKDSQSGKLHYVFKRTLNGNFLAPLKKDIKKCLELGYSSGILMMEMASRPLSPRDTYPDNCHFEFGNFYEKIPYPDECFDFVYLRLTMVHVKKSHYDFIMKETYRVLKKGGPIYKKFEQEVFESLQSRDIDPLKIHEIKDILPTIGFHNVKVTTFDIPLGWKEYAGSLEDVDKFE